MKRKLLLIFSMTGLVMFSTAQTKIGGAPGPMDGSAYLQLGDAANANKGLLLSRVNLTSTEVWGLAAASPTPAGMVVYNTNPNITGKEACGAGLYYWNGTQWVHWGTEWNKIGMLSTDPNSDARSDKDNPINRDGAVGIGLGGALIAPGAKLHIKGGDQDIVIDGIQDQPVIRLRRGEGASGNNNVTTPGTNVGGISFVGRNNNGYNPCAQIYSLYQGNGSNVLGSLNFETSGEEVPRLKINENGHIIMNALEPISGMLLTVNGNAAKWGGGDWAGYSDKRVKKNINDYTKGLKEILTIHPVTYQYNGKGGSPDNGVTYTGVIGQEIEKVLPNTITKSSTADFNDQLVFDPSELTYTLINAIKEQQAQIEALKKEVEELKRK